VLCTVQKRARILVSPRAVAAFRAAFDVDATGRPRIESKQVSEPWRAAMLELCANAVTAVAAADKESALYWIVGECVKKVNLLFRAAGVGTIKRATLLGTGKGAQKLAAKHAATAAEAEARALSEEANEKTLELEERLVSAFTLDELREAACLILDKENEEGEASEGSLLMAEKADLGWLHEQAEREGAPGVGRGADPPRDARPAKADAAAQPRLALSRPSGLPHSPVDDGLSNQPRRRQ